MPVISLKPEEEKPKEKPQGVILGVVLLIVALAVIGVLWGGLYYYKTLVNSNVATLNADIDAVQEEMVKYKEARSMNTILKKQIENISSMLESHLCWSGFFTKLEEMTAKKVYFTNFVGDEENSSVSLEGRAESYTILGEQLAVFRDSDMVKSFEIQQARMVSEGGKNYVEFGARLNLVDNVFKCSVQSLNNQENNQ